MYTYRLITGMAFVLLCCLPVRAKIYDITNFGAISSKATDNTESIRKAIESCAAAGGGTVYVPAGDYGCGGLLLKSNVTLHLEAGATLWVSPKKAHYKDGNRFLYARDQKNITISGRGTIHGTGREDLGRKKGDKRPRPDFRVGILQFVRCENVMIKDITVRYSDSWTFDLEFCQKVYITGVSILNNYYRVNADGIDPVSCKNVHISNCYIIAGDDCIVCKTRQGV